MTLKALREYLGFTQDEIKGKLGMSQSGISRFENTQDHKISTLRKYAEALGGKLKIKIKVKDKSHLIE